MSDWELHFRESRSFTCAAYETALSDAIRGPVTIEIGLLEINGDPRDGGKRPVTIKIQVDPFLQVVTQLDEHMRFIGDEGTFAQITRVTLKDAGASCSNKLDVWRRLRIELAKLGCTDETLEYNPAPILDELDAVGDRTTADQMRKDITSERDRSSPSPSPAAVVSTHIEPAPRADPIEEAPSRIEPTVQPSRNAPADELRPYFDAILAAPDDDEPRLELARILTERGDQRGEHIRLSCELEKLGREDPARAALEARSKQIPSFWWFAQPEISFPFQLGHRRGFVDEISCGIGHFVAYADVLMKQAPIRVYDANPAPEGQGPALAKCSALAKLRGLKLHFVKDDDAAAILASPYLRNLRELEVSRPLDAEADVAKLAAAMRGLAGLRKLSMFYSRIDGSACDALAKLADDMHLELLDVRSVNMPASGIAVLHARLGEERVMPRPEPRVKFKFGLLDLAPGALSVEEIRALIDSGEYRNATSLNLGDKQIGDAGVAHLARSGAFPNLKSLSVGGTGITDAGAYALANDSVGFDQLEKLWLGDVPAEGDSIGARDESGVSDRAVEAIARSARLPALRTIGRSKEYRRIVDDRAREEREVVTIKREDGRAVQSIIDHSMWP